MPGELTDETLWIWVDRDAAELEHVVRPTRSGSPRCLSAPRADCSGIWEEIE